MPHLQVFRISQTTRPTSYLSAKMQLVSSIASGLESCAMTSTLISLRFLQDSISFPRTCVCKNSPLINCAVVAVTRLSMRCHGYYSTLIRPQSGVSRAISLAVGGRRATSVSSLWTLVASCQRIVSDYDKMWRAGLREITTHLPDVSSASTQ